MKAPEHISARTTHTRSGAINRSFTYSVDYVLINPLARKGPLLFSRNAFNLFSVRDKHHGGRRGAGSGVEWAHAQFAKAGLENAEVLLLTQPSVLGYIFNPISFWLAFIGTELKSVIAEVNNTFGDRHSYLCHRPNFETITAQTKLRAEKMMHVSPFQGEDGFYSFNFNILAEKIAIRIEMSNENETLFANLTGSRRPLTDTSILFSALRRPFGPMRIICLIYWQALCLKLRGAPYRTRTEPPKEEISQ